MRSQNKEEAKKIIADLVNQYEAMSYSELRSWIDQGRVKTKEIKGNSGIKYQVELEARWDNKPGGDIRFSGAIYDDSQSRLFKIKTPLSYDFIKERDT